MNTKPGVSLFGQVLGAHSFLLKGGFLQQDAYAKPQARINEKYERNGWKKEPERNE